MPSPLSRTQTLLWTEIILIFAGLPMAAAYFELRYIGFLVMMGGALAISLTPPYRLAWDLKGLALNLQNHLQNHHTWAMYGIAFAGCAGLVFALRPELWLGFPSRNPERWALVIMLYPFLSALPQELIYRHWFFKRYQGLPSWFLRVANVLGFAWLHIIFGNWVAVVGSLVGGTYLTYSYQRHHSLTKVWLDHCVMGWIVFTTGLGWYFYLGLSR